MYIFVVVFSFVGNYNTFKLTATVIPAVNLGFFYMQQQLEKEKFEIDVQSGLALNKAEMEHFAKYKMNLLVGLIIFFVAQ